MQYCIYLRKSRADAEAEARGDGETLARHEKILLELAKKMNLDITEIYREIVSGETISSRPVMQQLLSEVEQGRWTGVLVMEVERLARGDTIDQGIVAQAFKYSNAKIITPLKIYDPNNEFDEEYFEFGLFMSRREYKTINRRLQQGRIASVKEGKYLGSIPPYGYKRKKLENQKGYTLETFPEQADIVKMIFQLYTHGEQKSDGSLKRLGISLIVRKLNALKIPPKKGDVWVPSTIQDMLRNPVYIGKIRWNWRKTVKRVVDGQIHRERPRTKDEECVLVEGLHKPIIDNETWKMAQKYLSQNEPRLTSTRSKVKNPLSGLVICGLCGRKMVRRPYKKTAASLMCPVTSCKNVSSKLTVVEERLLSALEGWLQDFKIKWGIDKPSPLKSQKNIKKKSIAKLEKALLEQEKQMSNTHDLLEQGVYSTETFIERSKVITEKITKTKLDRDMLMEELHLEEEKEKNLNTLIPKIERVLEMYANTDDPGLKNDLLKSVLKKAVYIKKVGGRWHTPEDFELILHPIIPE